MDVILCWPDNCDYPLYREFLRLHRHYFSKVIIVFTKSNQKPDFKSWVKQRMTYDDITFIDTPLVKGGDDWRDVAVKAGLELSTADWVWFTEQDVFVTDPKFWVDIITKIKDNDAILYSEDGRTHPCMAFVKRSTINRTSKDFSVIPDKGDHFIKFFTSLNLLPIKIAWVKKKYFYHMNGLSHNLALLQRGEPITYKPDEFRDYLTLCLQHPDNMTEDAIELARAYVGV